MNTNENDSPFGDVIYTYTRAHAVADGFQVEVTKTAQEAGIRFPVFLTRTVYDAYVTVPPDVTACRLRSTSATMTTAPGW